MPATKKRLHYFDNLKTAVITLIVAFHCAMCYMAYAPEWWYVLSEQRALPFTWFVIWADNFVMPIMFFISGFFGLKSLRSWKARAFWRKKFHRIGLPWLIGMVFLVPYIIWLWFFSRGIPISFHDLIVKQYFGQFYQQGVYWYLSALLALYFLLFCFARVYPKFLERPGPQEGQLKISYLLVYLAASAIPMFLLNLVYPDQKWVNVCYILVLQTTRVPIYIASFFFGACCERSNLLHNPGGFLFNYKFLLPVFALASFLFVCYRMHYPPQNAFDIFNNALVHCLFCAISLVTAVCVFRKFFNRTNQFFSLLAAISYPIYFIHQDVVQTVVLYVRQLPVDIYFNYLAALGISLAICYYACKLFLQKFSFFR